MVKWPNLEKYNAKIEIQMDEAGVPQNLVISSISNNEMNYSNSTQHASGFVLKTKNDGKSVLVKSFDEGIKLKDMYPLFDGYAQSKDLKDVNGLDSVSFKGELVFMEDLLEVENEYGEEPEVDIEENVDDSGILSNFTGVTDFMTESGIPDEDIASVYRIWLGMKSSGMINEIEEFVRSENPDEVKVYQNKFVENGGNFEDTKYGMFKNAYLTLLEYTRQKMFKLENEFKQEWSQNQLNELAGQFQKNVIDVIKSEHSRPKEVQSHFEKVISIYGYGFIKDFVDANDGEKNKMLKLFKTNVKRNNDEDYRVSMLTNPQRTQLKSPVLTSLKEEKYQNLAKQVFDSVKLENTI